MSKIIPLHSNPIKIKIDLEDMPFKIYRKLIIPSNITMADLHLVIQIAMGWENYHLFQFSDKKFDSTITVQSDIEEEDFFDEYKDDMISAEDLTLAEFLTHTNGKSFWYWYDFGDDWWHKISIQKLNKTEINSFKATPICTEAAGGCPPEDVGGAWGFEEFVKAINDPKNPQYKEFRAWMGMKPREKYDFEEIDVEHINHNLDFIWNMGGVEDEV